MNPNKRHKISSSQYLKILDPEENNNVIRTDKIVVKKRPYSPSVNETRRFSIKGTLDDASDLTKKTYTKAKKVLHHVYEIVSQKIGDINLKLFQKYTEVKIKGKFKTWCCSYNVNWPRSMEFKKRGPTKEKACHEAALSALLWLRKNGNITKSGEPIIPKNVKKSDDGDDVDKLELYDFPKQVLHNTYHEIATKYNNKDLQLEPVYVKREYSKGWSCKYCLKWPELKEFEEEGSSKREAAQGAALSSLLWLKNNAKITETGHPIINKTKSQSSVRLNIDLYTWDKIKAIIKEYNDFVQNNIKHEDFKETKPPLTEPGDVTFTKNFKQRYLGPNKYLAKERTPLPISAYKEEIISLLENNRVVVIKGQPGCGKSTCVPQYALEAWIRQTQSRREIFRIAVTQPRRLAAISLAERVSLERDEQCGLVVGYQIRLNSNFDKSTGRILYCTNGILLRHIQSDPTLENFPCVILDEAHERDANTDLLMLLLRRSLELNSRLKIIIMSATIDTDVFTNYFDGASVMLIDEFTYPVQMHFLEDLPVALNRTKSMCQSILPLVIHEEVARVILYIHESKNEGTILCFLPGWNDIIRVQALLPEDKLMVLCLHSKLQDSEQSKIFWPTFPGTRKVILATNIAETSVTINDVVYVIDTGIHKESRFCDVNGVICLDNQWISQASMIQRKGRAGRVQAGESFHLYTKSKYASMPKYTDPEILKISLTKIVLDAKAFYDCTNAWEFMGKLPTPPKRENVKKAVENLKILELVDDGESLTALGKILAQFQLEPKLSKAMVNAVLFKCVSPIVDIVTIFSSEIEMFHNVLSDNILIRHIKEQTGYGESDHMAMMTLFEEWLNMMDKYNEWTAQSFCGDTSLNHSNLLTLNELRNIHFGYLEDGLKINPLETLDVNSNNTELVKCALYSGLNTLLFSEKRGPKKIFLTNNSHEATITSQSVNYNKPKFSSRFLTYISEVRSKSRKINLIRECSTLSPLAVLLFSSRELQLDRTEDGRLLLTLKDSPVTFLCTIEEAHYLKMCKMALSEMRRHCINQLTGDGPYNEKVEKTWDSMLKIINAIFSTL